MCHQSVGLIARDLEASGIPTVSLTSALSITTSANPPRAVFLDYPLGHTAGPPNEPHTQLAIARSALSAFTSITEAGGVHYLDHVWPHDWKDEARALADHRSPRHDTPQYQSEADRLAAVDQYGEELACSACAFSEVPTR